MTGPVRRAQLDCANGESVAKVLEVLSSRRRRRRPLARAARRSTEGEARSAPRPFANQAEDQPVKRPHRHGPGNSAPPDVLAARGGEALRQERFKEAIELFKLAIRQEPRPEWKESLADAWRGRARDLAAKSMFKEAAMVLENTIASGGPVRDPKLYLTCLIRDGQQQKAAAYLLSHPAPSGRAHEDLEALAPRLCSWRFRGFRIPLRGRRRNRSAGGNSRSRPARRWRPGATARRRRKSIGFSMRFHSVPRSARSACC